MKRIIAFIIIAALITAVTAVDAKNSGNSAGSQQNSAAALASDNRPAVISDKYTNISQANRSSAPNAAAAAPGKANESLGQSNKTSKNLTSYREQQLEIKEQIKLMQNESANVSGSETNNRFKNQNTVRTAVLTLLLAGNISGGIGSQISSIAEEFNNSLAAQYNAEEKIQNRDSVSRFLFGGDSDSAGYIREKAAGNMERIQNLNTVLNDCDCDEELKEMIEAQIKVLEQEQNRLQEMSAAEAEDRGLFGGIFG
ncbi:hypothetical protein J2128_001357 [Methanomicrobium sp. W14]|uniref:hypothetical protein n=1 Tax=Methanomicrobium sp. W14 TaxID=2817839 RepID=UPI001AE31987|nr:hypothetical protein [Methanomicrobium sp. W14]MBP2133403.1 hypothetical protein [Methanomicrobium sp. W14]